MPALPLRAMLLPGTVASAGFVSDPSRVSRVHAPIQHRSSTRCPLHTRRGVAAAAPTRALQVCMPCSPGRFRGIVCLGSAGTDGGEALLLVTPVLHSQPPAAAVLLNLTRECTTWHKSVSVDWLAPW